MKKILILILITINLIGCISLPKKHFKPETIITTNPDLYINLKNIKSIKLIKNKDNSLYLLEFYFNPPKTNKISFTLSPEDYQMLRILVKENDEWVRVVKKIKKK